MVIFLESPWPILLIGIAVEAVLAVMLLRLPGYSFEVRAVDPDHRLVEVEMTRER